MTTLGPTASRTTAINDRNVAPTARHTNVPTELHAQLESLTATGQADMLRAARLEDALNRAQALAKLLEAGPKAAKDLLA